MCYMFGGKYKQNNVEIGCLPSPGIVGWWSITHQPMRSRTCDNHLSDVCM